MGKTNSTAKCIANQAWFWRQLKYKSANAAGKAMNMDPKTIRQIEDGEAVRLTTIQKYAELLSIPLDQILADEDLAALSHCRVLMNYNTKDIFRNSNLVNAGDHLKYEAQAPSKLGQACDASSFIDLFSKMTIDAQEWPPNGEPFIQPIWEIHESVPFTTPGLADLLEKLQLAILGTVMNRSSSLSSFISQIKAQSDFKQLFEELDEKCEAHILGCMVETHINQVHEDYYDRLINVSTHVKMPLFVIASNKIREFNLEYRHSLSEEDFNFKLELHDPEEQAEIIKKVNDEIEF